MPDPTEKTVLFGRFVGQSHLKQGDKRFQLTPESEISTAPSRLSPLLPVHELEGLFGVVEGHLDGTVLLQAGIVEVVPTVLSRVLDGLLVEQALAVEELLPRVQKSLGGILSTPTDESPPDSPTPLCALVVGHRPGARGACSEDRTVNEFDFNRALADEIARRVQRTRVEIVLRQNTSNGYQLLPEKINRLEPHFVVSLHCNAVDNRSVSGSETLYYHSSTGGHRMAKVLQRRVVDALGLRNRHTKPREASQRGGHLLRNTKAPAVICEPFFISNNDDLDLVSNRQAELAAAFATAIDEIADLHRDES